MESIAKYILYYNVNTRDLYDASGVFMGNTPFSVYFDNLISVELHYMEDTSSDSISGWVPWTALEGNTVGSSICFDDDYVHAKTGKIYADASVGDTSLIVHVSLDSEVVNPTGVLVVYKDQQSISVPYKGYIENANVYTFELENPLQIQLRQDDAVRVPQALLLKIDSDQIDNSRASQGIFSFNAHTLSHKLLNKLIYSGVSKISGVFEHQIVSDGNIVSTFTFGMVVNSLLGYDGQADIPKTGNWADKAYVDSKIITKTSELQNDAGFISQETDPVYSADKPNIALKSELFSKNFFDLIDVPTTLSGYGITDAFIRDNKITLNGEQIQIKETTAQDVKNFLGISEEIGSSIKYLNERGQFVPITSAVSVNGMLPDENGNINLSLYSIITLQELRRVTQTIESVNNVQPVDGNITLTMNDFQISLEEGQPAITVQNLLIQLYENSGKSSVISVCNQTPDDSGNIQLEASAIDYSNTDYPTVGQALNSIFSTLTQMEPSLLGVVRSVDGIEPDSHGNVQLQYWFDGTSYVLEDILNTFQHRIQQLQQNGGGSGGQVPQYYFQYPLTSDGTNVSIDLSNYALKSDLFSKSFNDLTGKPTTLEGYGITDASISGRTITLGGNSIEVPESGSGGEYTLTKEAVDGVIGASSTGSTAKFYNEQGAFTEVDMSGYLPLSGGTLTGTLNVGAIQADNLLNIGAGNYGGEHPSTMYLGTNGSSISSRFGVSIRSSHGYVDLYSATGVRINDVKAATVNDISTHATVPASSDTLGHIKVDNQTITVDENGVATAHAVGHNIFDIFYSMSSKAPAGAMDLSLGTLIASCDTVFPDFWSECLQRRGNAHMFPQFNGNFYYYWSGANVIGGQGIDGGNGNAVCCYNGNIYILATGDCDGHETPPPQSQEWRQFVVPTEQWDAQRQYFIGDTVLYNGQIWCARGVYIGDVEWNGVGIAPGQTDADGTTYWALYDLPIQIVAPSIRILTESEWQAEVTANGSCGAFVVDEDAKSIRLPKITKMIQPGDVGMFTEAGLPNITGNLPDFYAKTGQNAGAGALYYQTSISNAPVAASSGGYKGLYFDASKSNSVYGNSTTVQPPAVGAKLYIQVFTSAVPASMAQAGKFINMLESYLPLSGGTMTGNVFWNAETGFGIRYNDNSGTFGWGYGECTGSGIAFRGVGYNDRPGSFYIFARDATNTSGLTGTVEGTLTWRGNHVTALPGGYSGGTIYVGANRDIKTIADAIAYINRYSSGVNKKWTLKLDAGEYAIGMTIYGLWLAIEPASGSYSTACRLTGQLTVDHHAVLEVTKMHFGGTTNGTVNAGIYGKTSLIKCTNCTFYAGTSLTTSIQGEYGANFMLSGCKFYSPTTSFTNSWFQSIRIGGSCFAGIAGTTTFTGGGYSNAYAMVVYGGSYIHTGSGAVTISNYKYGVNASQSGNAYVGSTITFSNVTTKFTPAQGAVGNGNSYIN